MAIAKPMAQHVAKTSATALNRPGDTLGGSVDGTAMEVSINPPAAEKEKKASRPPKTTKHTRAQFFSRSRPTALTIPHAPNPNSTPAMIAIAATDGRG